VFAPGLMPSIVPECVRAASRRQVANHRLLQMFRVLSESVTSPLIVRSALDNSSRDMKSMLALGGQAKLSCLPAGDHGQDGHQEQHGVTCMARTVRSPAYVSLVVSGPLTRST